MVHQSLTTRPAVPSSTVPPKSHPEPDVLDVFGSRYNAVRDHFQRVLSLSAPAMIAIFAVYATLADMGLAFILEAMPFYSIADDEAAKAIDPRAMIADKGLWVTFIAAIFLAVAFLHGRHDYVLHARVPGPNVFLDCTADIAHNDSR